MIVLIAKVAVQAGKVEAFVREVNKAAEASMQEAGVNRYELVQSVGEANTYILIEEYTDDAAFASHNEEEHTKALLGAIGDMLAGAPEVEKYDVSDMELLS